MLLSKSKYLVGLQCLKALWIQVNAKDEIPPINESQQFIFDQGNAVGNIAKKLFPKGIEVDSSDFTNSINETKKLVEQRKTIFEAAFMKNKLYARADILEPVGKNEWGIIEVKSSTSVKEINLHDLSFQKFVYESCGLKIRKTFLLFINSKYERNGELELNELFSREDVTEKVNKISKGIELRIQEMFDVLFTKKRPEVCIGKNCKTPYECSLKNKCWNFLPQNNVFDLYRGGKKSFELFEQGVYSIKDIPSLFTLNEKQKIQFECEKNKCFHINKEKIKSFLKTLSYPLYFLDFETYSTAIPIHNKSKPYQQIPFQFSLHIQREENLELEHYSFLSKGKTDSRGEFLKKLKELLGEKGSVVVYNESFEKSRLKELAIFFPKEKDWVEQVNSRVIDLLIPFRNFDYYNPSQCGSASIKKVLPATTDKSYSGMKISNGGMASTQFLYITTFFPNKNPPSESQIKKIRENLEKYCALDTLAEYFILEKLKQEVKE